MEIWNNFIVIEGIDGSGTTTQLELMKKKFRNIDKQGFFTFEPTDRPVGKLIRRALRKEIQLPHESLAKLFSADREDHLFGTGATISQALGQGQIVFSDRYFFSSLVYQGLEVGFDHVLELNQGFPLPEHLFFIDVDDETAAQRRSDRDQVELYEKRNLQAKIVSQYHKVINHFKSSIMSIHRLNGSSTAEEIHFEICRILGL